MSAGTGTGDRGELALIRYRLDQIETNLERAARWRRQVFTGGAIALTLPVGQSLVALIRMMEGT